MILRRRVSLAGVQLDEIHDAVVIRKVDPGTAVENITTADRMGGWGQRVTGAHTQALEASVSYAIDLPKTMLAERREIFDAVNSWATSGGWLRTNEMPGRRMYVDRAVVPDGGDMRDWTREHQILFRAYNVPFWQDEDKASASSGTVSSGTVYLDVGGNAGSVLDVTFQNRSGKTISSFWVQANGHRITLSGMNLGGSASLVISHGNDGLLRITAGGTNVYSKYTGADDLYVNPGRVAVSFSAERAGILTVTNCGRWL